jgi:hypothetical protein
MPRPPCERSIVCSTWTNGSKMRGSISGAIPMPSSATRDDQVLPLGPGGQLDAAPRLGVLGGVGQQVDQDLLQPRRVRLDPHRPRVDGDVQPMLAGLDERPDRLDGVPDERGGVLRAVRSWIFPG